MSELATKIKVLLAAVPTWGAAIVGILTAIQVQVVPLLPSAYGTQVYVWLATAIVQITAVVKTVSRVTEVPPALRGLSVDPAIDGTRWHTPTGAGYAYFGVGETGTSGITTTYRSKVTVPSSDELPRVDVTANEDDQD